MRSIYTILLCCLFGAALSAQTPCPDTQQELTIYVDTDNWGFETAYILSTSDGTVLSTVEEGDLNNNQSYEFDVCIDSTCLLFTLTDDYGDGITGNNGVHLVVDGDTLWSSPSFSYETSFGFWCEDGLLCNTADPVDPGTHLAENANSWYAFTPAETGLYEISTCDLTTCATTIWVYESCPPGFAPVDNEGTYLYSNQNSECFPQAHLQGGFAAGQTYIIRIGYAVGTCPGGTQWELSYQGEIPGCTDPTSCNYDPLATIDDGSCIPNGDPDCPEAPDLALDQATLQSSIQLDYLNGDDACLIEEDCIQGFGVREIIRFSTRIDNIGELDYYIGQESANNDQFTFSSCHNHYHYDSYAEYLLFDADGHLLPAGFKNGFCVLDLGCTTGSAQYSCGNMGISAGCYDEYWAGLECQWIDITDVPDGDYTLVVRTNWKNAPDFLGRVEKDTLNNWAQVCINIDRSGTNTDLTVIADCPAFVDCAGVPYGNSVPDCAGVCGGTALYGDLDGNGVQETEDVMTYLDMAMSLDIIPNTCEDLSADGLFTVYDANMLNDCLLFGNTHVHTDETNHDHCEFPNGFYSETDTVTLGILQANWEENYMDIGVLTPHSPLSAYQFRMAGIEVSSVENLQPADQYAPIVRAGLGSNMVLGMSMGEDRVPKSVEWQPLCRVYFSSVTADLVCIDYIVDIVNERLDQLTQVVTQLENACLMTVGTHDADLPQLAVRVAPNPMESSTIFSIPPTREMTCRLTLTDAAGRLVRTVWPATGADYTLPRADLPTGTYFYRISNGDGIATGRLVVQ